MVFGEIPGVPQTKMFEMKSAKKLVQFAVAVLLISSAINASWGSSTSFRQSDDFQYGDFVAPTDLIFQGAASVHEDRVRLTPAEQGKVGGLWFQNKPLVQNGFETTFRFQLTDPGGHGANGLAFVVQNNPTPQLGIAGHGIGFRGISNAVVIKFDPYNYRHKEHMDFDQISVLTHPPANMYPANAGTIGFTTNAVFKDGKVHTVKISYQPGTLRVFFDTFTDPLLTVSLNLAEEVTLDGGRAWVGFTSATGADYFNQDLLSWTFSTPENWAAPAVASSTPSASAKASAQPEPVYAGEPSPTPTTPLAHDPAFGYAVPAGIALTHPLEASTDLIHWVPVTNAALYFRDPDSTNYESRFYRLVGK
jgi:hypothetical protein